MPNFNDIVILMPELYLIAAACVLLLMDAFMKPGERQAIHWLTIIVLLVTIVLVVAGQPDHAETAFGGMVFEDTPTVQGLLRRFDTIRAQAWSAPESLNVIRRIRRHSSQEGAAYLPVGQFGG